MVLVNGIDLNDGNMDMGKMKSVLDADVENIRNAKATVEKMIEEKMLGTEAEGCMNSEDPVNLSTGNFIYEHEDLKVAGEIPLSFHRYYNSKDSRTGVLGRCFLHNYQIALEKEADGTIGVRLADGQINYHDKKGQEYIARNTALEFLKETDIFSCIRGRRTYLLIRKERCFEKKTEMEEVFLFSIVKMES